MPEWDGIKIEEEKMRSEKLIRGGPKSRIHWDTAGVCLKDCRNRDIKCDGCIRFSELIEI